MLINKYQNKNIFVYIYMLSNKVINVCSYESIEIPIN